MKPGIIIICILFIFLASCQSTIQYENPPTQDKVISSQINATPEIVVPSLENIDLDWINSASAGMTNHERFDVLKFEDGTIWRRLDNNGQIIFDDGVEFNYIKEGNVLEDLTYSISSRMLLERLALDDKKDSLKLVIVSEDEHHYYVNFHYGLYYTVLESTMDPYNDCSEKCIFSISSTNLPFTKRIWIGPNQLHDIYMDTTGWKVDGMSIDSYGIFKIGSYDYELKSGSMTSTTAAIQLKRV